jgi:uncharacterized protein (DUF433 family)
MPILDHITINSEICLGQPSIRGMRITVSVILRMLASGHTRQEILQAYPELEPADIDQVLLYAAWLACEQSLPFPAA